VTRPVPRTSTLVLLAAAAALLSGLLPRAAEAQACAQVSASIDSHVSAGRARKVTTQSCSACVFGICGFPSGCDTSNTGYYAVGSDEYLGGSGATTVTLYQTGTVSSTTPPASESSCTDKADNDCDGLIDCQDPQCGSNAACAAPPPPTLRYASVHGASFVSGDATGYDYAGVTPRAQLWIGAVTVSLPDGAVVREMRCSTVLGAPLVNGTARFQSQNLIAGGSTVTPALDAIFSATTAAGFVSARSSAASGVPPINNRDNAYAILLALTHSSTPTDGYIVGCTLGYTL
jgi:hypothetical protein